MTAPRRRILRPPPAGPASDAQTVRNLQKRRAQLDTERLALKRWMSRLRRAFNAVEKRQQKIARLERQIAGLESV